MAFQQPLPKISSRDALSGLIVFLIALPLCLGIAQASGAPPFAGIIAGVIGGIIIGALSGSALSVSGPAAGLIAIVVTALATLGSFEVFLCSVIVAGGVQFLLGMLRAGGIADYIPTNVIEGMLAGIGVTIIFKEVVNAVGFDKKAFVAEGETGFQWNDIVDAFQHIEPGAVIISVTGLLILAMWNTKAFKKLKLVPAGLLVVLLGVLLNEIFQANSPAFGLGDSHLVNLQVPHTVNEFFGQFTLPDVRGFANPQVWITGVVIAVVASIETLLCIEATDKLDPLKRVTPTNRELRAQGIGNLVSGLIGGLPITSVIVRSSANINSGARTKLSTIIHGSLLLVCVASIPALLNHIPKAALAAILIFTGYRLARPAVWRHMYKAGWNQFLPFLATVLCVVFLDLLKGVGVGLMISIIFLLRQNARIPYYFQRSSFSNGDLIKLTLAQEVSFLNKASIKQTLDKLPQNSAVIIDATATEYIDYDVLEVIRDFHHSRAPERGIRLSLIGFQDEYKVPQASTEREVVGNLIDAHDEVPKRSAGDYKDLLKELKDRTDTDGTDGTSGTPAARSQS
jgi:MFS superfamily sulfate permease-like transporter